MTRRCPFKRDRPGQLICCDGAHLVVPSPPPQRTEAQIQADICLRLGARPDVYLSRNNVGAAVRGTRRVSFGVKGSADLMGLLALTVAPGWLIGIGLAIEVKTATGRLRPDQVVFRDVFLRFGGVHIVARSADEAEQLLDAAKRERLTWLGHGRENHA